MSIQEFSFKVYSVNMLHVSVYYLFSVFVTSLQVTISVSLTSLTGPSFLN